MHKRASGWDNGSVIYDLYKILLYETLVLCNTFALKNSFICAL